jgi:hypothetical protein
VIVPARREDPQLDALPDWPSPTLAVLSTIGDELHSIPVATVLRAGARRILFSLERDHASLDRLREHPQAAIVILGDGNVAFTARGRARVVEESLPSAPDFAALVLDVDAIDDHRQPGYAVRSGIDVRGIGERNLAGLRARIDALRDLAARNGFAL